ncbi:MAG: isoprenyl transferase [Verrucomicrobia bacterium]|nr:isoprenyl transferase [Verrucomicrobiota bacterium]
MTVTSCYGSEELALLDRNRMPRHVAIIMDGNRRWARERGLLPLFGHWKGAETLKHIVRAASELGIQVLTVYAFSTENWMRPKEEVDELMEVMRYYLIDLREQMLADGVRLQTIGDIQRFPRAVLDELEKTKSLTADCKKIDLVLAMNYGGRDDIRRAFVALVEDVEKGRLKKEEITEQRIGRYLDSAPWPDPEILIRPSGERRLSNFLLWQLSYSEFYHTDVLWPDFDEMELLKAMLDYQQRERRFGAG